MKSRAMALKCGQDMLKAAGIEDYYSDAWILYEEVCKCDRTHFLLEQAEQMPEDAWRRYEKLLKRRCERIPVQYIIGRQEFMGYSFCVDERVLIPRMDTELLVQAVQRYTGGSEQVLDMCTGSGCIAISLKKNNPNLCVWAVDISDKALCVARQNAVNLACTVEFLESDLFEQFRRVETGMKFDVIVSNPPYIPTKVIDGLEEEVRSHEPLSALDGEEDGLAFYRRITKDACEFLNEEGKLFFEVGHNQGEDVARLMEDAGFSDIEIEKDLAGHDRVVYGGMKHV